MAAMHAITNWNPEDEAFWERSGRSVATRNLWLSIPALALAFAVWMVWSVVVVNLPSAGFQFSTNQLFWLAALPALCGATLRIFYSFVVPIVGGRRWTAISTASPTRSAPVIDTKMPDKRRRTWGGVSVTCTPQL